MVKNLKCIEKAWFPAMVFWMFGFLSVVLAILKLTVAGYWSWWIHLRGEVLRE